MGNLSSLNVAGYLSAYGCQHFIETGTGCGAGLGEALKHPFKSLQSCEMEYVLFEAGREFFEKHRDDRLKLYHGQSSEMLPAMLEQIPADEPILFWLDAHFPGADFNLKSPDDEWRDDVRLPLETELKIIRRFRPRNKDVILMDDARIYVDANFEAGSIPDTHRHLVPKVRTITFISTLFESHIFEMSTADHGYIILRPAP